MTDNFSLSKNSQTSQFFLHNSELSNKKRVTPAGFKPTISGTGILHSIQLNYGAPFSLAKVNKKLGPCKPTPLKILKKEEKKTCILHIRASLSASSLLSSSR